MGKSDKTNIVAIISGLYIAIQMLSDIMSLRILSLAGLSIDGGTIIYPLTFTIRDLIHRVCGKSITRSIVILAAIINIFMIIMFWIVSILPPDMTVGSQEMFGIILVPAWRIVVASIVAEVMAELLDGEIYEKWERKFGETKIWGRVLSSNAISIPIDSGVFVIIAFFGTMPASVVLSIFISNVIIKYIIGTISFPIIYMAQNEEKNRFNLLRRRQ